MRQPLVILVLAAALIASALVGGRAAPAQGATTVGTCPDSFQLITIRKLAQLLGISYAEALGIPAVDNNGNGYTCYSTSASGNLHGTDDKL